MPQLLAEAEPEAATTAEAAAAQGPSTTAPAKAVAEAAVADRLGLNPSSPIFALGRAGKTQQVTD
jgi:hypothetical protein